MKKLKRQLGDVTSPSNNPDIKCNPCEQENTEKFGHIVVQNLEELYRFPCKLRVPGMSATVVEEGYAEFQLKATEESKCNNSNWQVAEGGGLWKYVSSGREDEEREEEGYIENIQGVSARLKEGYKVEHPRDLVTKEYYENNIPGTFESGDNTLIEIDGKWYSNVRTHLVARDFDFETPFPLNLQTEGIFSIAADFVFVNGEKVPEEFLDRRPNGNILVGDFTDNIIEVSGDYIVEVVGKSFIIAPDGESPFYTKDEVNSLLGTVTVDLSNYYDKDEVDDVVETATNGVATQTWVTNQNYAYKNASNMSAQDVQAWKDTLNIVSENLYNSNGTLSGNRVVNLNGYKLKFQGGLVESNKYTFEELSANITPNTLWSKGSSLFFTDSSGNQQELKTSGNSLQETISLTTNANIESVHNGRNIVYDIGGSNITLFVNANLPRDFIVSGIKEGTGRLTITGAAGIVVRILTYTDVVYGIPGSRFMLSRVGSSNVFNLYVSNYE